MACCCLVGPVGMQMRTPPALSLKPERLSACPGRISPAGARLRALSMRGRAPRGAPCTISCMRAAHWQTACWPLRVFGVGARRSLPRPPLL